MFSSRYGFSQTQDSSILQLSGVVIDQVTLEPVSYITVRIKGTVIGVVSNYEGFFSIPIHRKDTIEFTSVGYQPAFFTPTQNTPLFKFFVSIKMKTAIYTLKGITVRGLTREQFKREFFTIKLPPMPEINPAVRVKSSQIELPPPPPGIRFSPSQLIGEIPFIKKALKKKRSKKFAKANAKDIPVMK
jgi:hypothetical protein